MSGRTSRRRERRLVGAVAQAVGRRAGPRPRGPVETWPTTRAPKMAVPFNTSYVERLLEERVRTLSTSSPSSAARPPPPPVALCTIKQPERLRLAYFSHEYSACRHWVGMPSRTSAAVRQADADRHNGGREASSSTGAGTGTSTLRVVHATYCKALQPLVEATLGRVRRSRYELRKMAAGGSSFGDGIGAG